MLGPVDEEAVLVEVSEVPVVMRSEPQVVLVEDFGRRKGKATSFKEVCTEELSVMLARGLGSTRSLLRGGILAGKELAREDMAGKMDVSERLREEDMRVGL